MKKKNNIIAGLVIFSLGFGSAKGLSWYESNQSSINPLITNYSSLESAKEIFANNDTYLATQIPDPSTSNEVCFTPPKGCAKVIARAITKAKESIFVQAYGFSHPLISEALINAKKKGLEVKIILDKSNLSQKYSKIKDLKDAGIEVAIDNVPGIAHNKVMIIDKKTVITGSFNFTNNADNSNAENVLIVKDKDLAEKYFQNWEIRSRSIKIPRGKNKSSLSPTSNKN